MTDAQIQALLSAVRTMLASGGTAAVMLGITDAAHVSALTAQIMSVLGAVGVLIPLVWGIYQKFTAASQTKTVAVQAFREGVKQEAEPVPTPRSEPEITAALNRAQILPSKG